MSKEPKDSRVRILIVDDSAFMRAALSRLIASDPDLSVVGSACSGMEALQQLPSLDPDVITLDMRMPGLDGLETLRRIMAEFPRPVILVSSLTLKDAEITLNALEAGAFDYVPKQLSSTSLDIHHLRDDLITKIKAAGESQHSRRQQSGLSQKPLQSGPMLGREIVDSTTSIVAIGTSTGGPKALQEILPALPADLPVPILIVQHMPLGFTAPFAERLNSLCKVSVCEAKDGESVQAGVVYVAPAGSHMTVERGVSRTAICLSSHPENQLHTPSVDVMMQSVATAFRSTAMGIIMTGMGSDGAEGIKAIHRDGGFTLGQDEQTCAVYGMPRACAGMGILDRIVPLWEIPHEIVLATRQRTSSAG